MTEPSKISFLEGPERGKPHEATLSVTAANKTPRNRRDVVFFTAQVSSTYDFCLVF
jgi:hypothetical protein